jgi:rhodanese-related sulfurtransferase
MNQITATDLKKRLDANENLLLLDVREDYEVAASSIPGRVHIPLGQLQLQLEDLKQQASEREVVCICRSGGRSLTAAALLAAHGLRTTNLVGGMTAWRAEVDPSLVVA